MFDGVDGNFSANTIGSASLTLTRTKGVTESTFVFTLHALQRAWTVGTSTASKGQCVDATNGDVTFMYSSYSTSEWMTSGGDYSSTPIASATLDGNLLTFDGKTTSFLIALQWFSCEMMVFG
eukprot:m.43288 g.43288  ORF g.43288 m.43288 type:complete len:122 (-) comp10548_c0_seq3:476-841(-)